MTSPSADIIDIAGDMFASDFNIWESQDAFLADKTVSYFRDNRMYSYETGEQGNEDNSITGVRNIRTTLGSRKFITFTHKFSLYKHLNVKRGAIPDKFFTSMTGMVNNRFYVRFGYVVFSTRGAREPMSHYTIPMQFAQQVEIDYAIEFRNPVEDPEQVANLQSLVNEINSQNLIREEARKIAREPVRLQAKRQRVDADVQ